MIKKNTRIVQAFSDNSNLKRVNNLNEVHKKKTGKHHKGLFKYEISKTAVRQAPGLGRRRVLARAAEQSDEARSLLVILTHAGTTSSYLCLGFFLNWLHIFGFNYIALKVQTMSLNAYTVFSKS